MGRSSDVSVLGMRRQLSQTQAVYCTLTAMIQDIWIYSCFVPLLSVYISGSISYQFFLAPRHETVLTVFITFSMMYLAFTMFGEASFWKQLFSFNKFYVGLLQIRDLLNTATLIVCLYLLTTSIERMIADKQMKPYYLGEGACYVFLKAIAKGCGCFPILLQKFGLRLPQQGPNFTGENERFEHGAAFMLYWSMLTACVAKMLYFNTLFTYIRSMRIFLSLHPTFDGGYDDESSSSSNTGSEESFNAPVAGTSTKPTGRNK